MKLLISNDDGISALGVRTLANTLAQSGHDITVVCPDRERSATGHGLTLHKPIRADQVSSGFHSSIQAWSCSGTPSDCVKLALGALLSSPPDIVLSGINHGSNLGTDVLYSGTVSAAMEGVLEGIPGIAFSLASFTPQDFQPAANFAQVLINHISQCPLPKIMLLNVNVPAAKQDEIAGTALTRQGVRRYYDWFETRTDPRGKTYYWLAGEVLEEIDEPGLTDIPGFKAIGSDAQWFRDMDTDVQAIQHNYITITPLQYDLTFGSGLASLRDWKLEFSNKL
ncbi:MAG: 5'/3'-nucleotidase SurE [Elainellaceae cyanobacterium]